MNFEQAHEAFIALHLQKRTGERRGRLERGHREAEKSFCGNVWWSFRGNFDNLHPEFEVLDWRGMSYFCDFAWLTVWVKLIIEIKGARSVAKYLHNRRFAPPRNNRENKNG